jgi:dolichol kinase
VAWIKIWTQLAERGVIDAKLARKIVHCGSGPLYLLVWRFYSDAALARVVAALVPALNIVKLQKAAQDDNELSRAISRSGDPSEVLGGPYVYTWVLLLAALVAFRTPCAIVAVAQMAVGDGLADIIGRRFGSKKWFCNQEKSYAGSLAFVLGATGASIGLLRWLGFPAPLAPLFTISCACALVEVLLTGVDDNVSVPLVGGLLALTIT